MSFKEPNYTQTPNELFDLLPLMKYAELKVTLVTIRETLGYHRASAALSQADMQRLTGLSVPAILTGANAAEERGTLTRTYGADGKAVWTLNLVGEAAEKLLLNPIKLLNTPQLSSFTGGCQVTLPSTSKKEKRSKKVKAIGANEPPENNPRERDLLFDAIVAVTKVDPKTAGASIGKVKKALLGADPPYTPKEVYAYGLWHQSDPFRQKQGPPSLWNLQEKIGIVRNDQHGGLNEQSNATTGINRVNGRTAITASRALTDADRATAERILARQAERRKEPVPIAT